MERACAGTRLEKCVLDVNVQMCEFDRHTPGCNPFVSPSPKRQGLRLRKFDEVVEVDDGQSGQRKQRLGSSTRLRMAAASHSR